MSRRNSVNDLDADFVYAFNGRNMTDIVERLRLPAPIDRWQTVLLERKEAADEIERLREFEVWSEDQRARLHGHIKRLREALRNIADPNTDYEAGVEIAHAAIRALKDHSPQQDSS